MTNETNLPDYDDDHLVETFGPIMMDEDLDWDAGPQDDDFEPFPSAGEEAHFNHTLRDFEELLRDYGVQRIIEDMEEETVAALMEYFDE